MKFINPIQYIKKKLSNYLLDKQQKKRIEVLKTLSSNDKNKTVNQKWGFLIMNKKYLTQAEYDKWYYYLSNYENIHNVK